MKTAIVIPARYASTRLPGKPLLMIRGQSMLERVVRLCRAAVKQNENVELCVATDDQRIARHCDELGVTVVMTPSELPSGTDRVAAAMEQLRVQPDFILNMQGDAPLTPPDFIDRLIDAFATADCDVVTPVVQLSWDELDRLRHNKLNTPFSGTTAVFDQDNGRAFWFSKTIIPAIRNEAGLRQQQDKSPVWRHIGLYGYSRKALLACRDLPESPYETLEGLEQLRLLENGYRIRCVPVEFRGRANMSGIDSPDDLARAEALIDQHGELLNEQEQP